MHTSGVAASKSSVFLCPKKIACAPQSTVDVHCLSEAFGGAISEYFDLEPTDGAITYSYLRKGGKF